MLGDLGVRTRSNYLSHRSPHLAVRYRRVPRSPDRGNHRGPEGAHLPESSLRCPRACHCGCRSSRRHSGMDSCSPCPDAVGVPVATVSINGRRRTRACLAAPDTPVKYLSSARNSRV